MPATQARSFKLTDQDIADLDELKELLSPGYSMTRTATVKIVIRERLASERKKAAKKSEKDSR